jgi:hypothetical protein
MTTVKKGPNKFIVILRRSITWGRTQLHWGLRSALGILLVAAGLLGFLPILGFWMIPVGLAFIALDIPPLRRRLRRWLKEHEQDNK